MGVRCAPIKMKVATEPTQCQTGRSRLAGMSFSTSDGENFLRERCGPLTGQQEKVARQAAIFPAGASNSARVGIAVVYLAPQVEGIGNALTPANPASKASASYSI